MKQRLAILRDQIERACQSVQRDPGEVILIAVTKTVAADDIQRAYDHGLRNFGESRLQEALSKMDAMPDDIVWHFIGKLQSNKSRKAGERFDVIHTIETSAQLQELAKLTKPVDILIEVNIAEEAQKSGVSVQELARFHQEVLQSPQVHFRGLMTVGPAHQNAEQKRPFFRTMRKLLEQTGGDWLSMGMSADFEVAIQEGSTHVRVGTALFGTRI